MVNDRYALTQVFTKMLISTLKLLYLLITKNNGYISNLFVISSKHTTRFSFKHFLIWLILKYISWTGSLFFFYLLNRYIVFLSSTYRNIQLSFILIISITYSLIYHPSLTLKPFLSLMSTKNNILYSSPNSWAFSPFSPSVSFHRYIQ